MKAVGEWAQVPELRPLTTGDSLTEKQKHRRHVRLWLTSHRSLTSYFVAGTMSAMVNGDPAA